ncbi:MAG TPA: arylesterase [Desulfuromonadales bacterium]|nr:arylesterase [Desulfuromonadales bacterium]
MRIKSFSFLILVLLALALSGCKNRPEISRLEPDAVILAFGNSLTYGSGAPREQSYPAQLQKLLNRLVVNAGIPGEVSAAGLARLPEVLAEHRPDLVILCHGGNDFLRQHDTALVRGNLREMVSLIKGSGIDVILVSVPRIGLLLSPAPFYAEISEEFDIPLAGEILTEVLSEPSLKSDRIHPNARGYGIMAESFARLIEETQGS